MQPVIYADAAVPVDGGVVLLRRDEPVAKLAMPNPDDARFTAATLNSVYRNARRARDR